MKQDSCECRRVEVWPFRRCAVAGRRGVPVEWRSWRPAPSQSPSPWQTVTMTPTTPSHAPVLHHRDVIAPAAHTRSAAFLSLISSDLISSALRALWLVAATANSVVRCEATQLVVAAANHSALSSDEMRSDEMRWDAWYERLFRELRSSFRTKIAC